MKMERKVPRRCQEVFCIKFDFGKGVGEKRMLNFWIFYLFTLSILSWCSRDLAAQTGDVFWVRVIVPVIKEVMALWSFHPRLTHCSFKNSTPVSAAGLVDPRVSQFSSWCVRVCPQTDIADIEHCFGKEEEGVSFLRSSCWIFEWGWPPVFPCRFYPDVHETLLLRRGMCFEYVWSYRL